MGTGKSLVRVGTIWPPFEMPGKGPEMSSGDYLDGPQGQKERSFPDDGKKTLQEKKGCCHSLLMSQNKLNPPAAPSAACAVNLPLPLLKRRTSAVCSGLGQLDLETHTTDFC